MTVRMCIRYLTFAAAAAFMILLLTARPAQAAANDYYVSQSAGSDANNGTSSATPWKTLAKASTVTYQPGDRLLLKSGDTWNEQLTLHGNGTANNVITVTSYGSGNRPLIQRSNYQFNGDIGIYMQDPSYWTISNLDFRQVWNGIMVEFVTGLNKGLTVENVGFYDSPYAEYDPDYWPQKAARGFYTYVAPGHKPANPVIDGLTFRNIYARNMGGGIHWEFGGVGNDGYANKNVSVSDSVFEDGMFMQLSMLNTDTGSLKNVKFFNNGMTVDNGPANFSIYDSKNIVMTDVETAYNRRENSPIDGDGFDMSNCYNCHFTNFLVHHNSQLAMLVSGGQPEQNVTFDNTVFYNDRTNVLPPPYQPIEIYPFAHGTYLFRDSRIYPGDGALVAGWNSETLVLKDSFTGDIQSETNSPNLALSATATASSSYTGLSAANGNDGNSATAWRSAAGKAAGEWLQLDFGSPRMVDKLVVEEDAASSISRFVIQYWDAAASVWRDMYTGKNIGSSVYDNNMPVPGRLVSKIRLYVVSTTSGEPIIKEFKAYNNQYGKIDAFANAGFETGTFTNWTTSGTAFDSSPYSTRHYDLNGWDGAYWGDSTPGGAATGTLTSASFTAGLKLTFLGAGWDGTTLQNNSYFYLKRSSDNAVLLSGRPPQTDSFVPYEWDTSAYAGTQVYFQVVDGNASGGFDWLAVDRLRIMRGDTAPPAAVAPTSISNPPYRDDFGSGTLGSIWSWVRPDGANWSLTANPGYMRIATQPGELFQTTNTAKNLLLRNAPDGDWTISTKLTYSPTAGNQQAGLIVYLDDDNYVKLVRGYTTSDRISFQKETAGAFDNLYEVNGVTAGTVYLKLAKSGTTYTAYYNTDGSETWTPIYQTTFSPRGARIGLSSFGGATGPQADFDWFDIRTPRHTDDFNSRTLDTLKWSWKREDNTKWNLTANPGSLQIVAQPGELYQTTNTAKNVLLRSAPDGDWTVKTKLSFTPSAGNQQAGIIVYQNDDNYLKLVRAYTSSNRIAFQKETGGVFSSISELDGISATTLYLMIVKSGTTYTAYYNTDGGESWTKIGQSTISLNSIKIGLISYGGNGTDPNAEFDWFDVGTPQNYTDEFNNSTLDSAWRWRWEDSTRWSLTANPGAMRIGTQPGELFESTNTAKNVLLRAAPDGNWTMKTKLNYHPTTGNQQAGLIVYQDEANYMKLVRAHTSSDLIAFQKETAGTFSNLYEASGVTSGTVFLKLVKSGTTYSAYYNTDGTDTWTLLTSTTMNLSGIKIGLISYGGPTGAQADFDWFDIKEQ